MTNIFPFYNKDSIVYTYFSCLYPLKIQARCPGITPQLSVCLGQRVSRFCRLLMRKKGCKCLTPTHWAFRNPLRVNPVPRCEPNTYSPLADDLATTPPRPVIMDTLPVTIITPKQLHFPDSVYRRHKNIDGNLHVNLTSTKGLPDSIAKYHVPIFVLPPQITRCKRALTLFSDSSVLCEYFFNCWKWREKKNDVFVLFFYEMLFYISTLFLGTISETCCKVGVPSQSLFN